MKTTSIKATVCFAVAGLFFGSFARAAEPLDLTAFKGNYNGTVTMRSPDNTLNGRAIVTFAVPKNGRSARISYRSVVTDGMDSSEFSTLVALAPNNTVSVTDLQVGIAGTNNAKRGRGDWLQRRRSLKFTATNGEGLTLQGTAVARDFSNRRELVLTLISSDPGGSTVFTHRLRSRLP